MLSTNQKGAIAETKIAAEATALGIPVLRPIVEHGRYDLAFEIEGRISAFSASGVHSTRLRESSRSI
jgi:hypothetical protein